MVETCNEKGWRSVTPDELLEVLYKVNREQARDRFAANPPLELFSHRSPEETAKAQWAYADAMLATRETSRVKKETL